MTTLNNQPNEEQLEQDYVRLSCNHILQATAIDSDSEPAASDSEVDQRLMVLSGETPPKSSQHNLKIQRQRAGYIRVLALLCACSLSVGSH
jgi:hypothetical protein